MGTDVVDRTAATPRPASPGAPPRSLRSTVRRRRVRELSLVVSLGVVAFLTLRPEGSGWAWGAPTVELRWYLTGLDSTATVLQLAGNLALLVGPAAIAVLRWPALARFGRLAAISLATGTGIELLQRVLPLGRVVSPLDAVLNATGALTAGLLVAHLQRLRGPAPGR